MSQSHNPRRHPHAAYKMVDGEALIVLPGASASHHVLNSVGACVWEMLDGTHDIRSICARVTEDFSVSPDAAEQDVREFLRELQENGMLDSATEGGNGT